MPSPKHITLVLFAGISLAGCTTGGKNEDYEAADIRIERPVVQLPEGAGAMRQDSEFSRRLNATYAKATEVDDASDFAAKIKRLEEVIQEADSLRVAATQATKEGRESLTRLDSELNKAYRRSKLWKALESAREMSAKNKASALDCAACAESERDAADAILHETIFSTPDKMLAEEVFFDAQRRFALAKADIALDEIQKARSNASTPIAAMSTAEESMRLLDGLLAKENKFSYQSRLRFQAKRAEVMADKDKLGAVSESLLREARRALEKSRNDFIRQKALADVQFARSAYEQLADTRSFNIDYEGRMRIVQAILHCDRVLNTRVNLPDDLQFQGTELREKCWDKGLNSWWGTASRARNVYSSSKPLTPYTQMPDFPCDDIDQRIRRRWQELQGKQE